VKGTAPVGYRAVRGRCWLRRLFIYLRTLRTVCFAAQHSRSWDHQRWWWRRKRNDEAVALRFALTCNDCCFELQLILNDRFVAGGDCDVARLLNLSLLKNFLVDNFYLRVQNLALEILHCRQI